MSDKGDATASITVLDTRSRMAVGTATNTNPLWIKGLGIRVPMHREFRLIAGLGFLPLLGAVIGERSACSFNLGDYLGFRTATSQYMA